MAELSFEQKVEGLQTYYQALKELDPGDPEHAAIADPNLFYYADGHHASYPLQAVKSGVLTDLGLQGRVEYSQRGLSANDLREDTDAMRAERADVLSVMTAPVTAAVREQRAERIAGLLTSITSGETVRLTKYDGFYGRYKEPQDVAADLGRSLFAVFRNGYVADRTITLQYDTPKTFAPTNEAPVGEPLVDIAVVDLFKLSGFRHRVPSLVAEIIAA